MSILTPGVQVRQFPLAFEMLDVEGKKDRRTIFGRVVPYGEIAVFTDHDGRTKRERFVRGSLAEQAKAWHRVTLTFEHLQGFANTIGYGRSLEESDDGAYASFRLYERDADKAREMLEESHRGLSLEFLAINDRLAADGVIDRQRVWVERVSMVPDAAYAGAEVLAIRERQHAPAAPPTPYLDSVLADLDALRRDS